MQCFFVEPHQIEEAKHHIHINGTDVNHIKNVLRMDVVRMSGSATVERKNITAG